MEMRVRKMRSSGYFEEPGGQCDDSIDQYDAQEELKQFLYEHHMMSGIIQDLNKVVSNPGFRVTDQFNSHVKMMGVCLLKTDKNCKGLT